MPSWVVILLSVANDAETPRPSLARFENNAGNATHHGVGGTGHGLNGERRPTQPRITDGVTGQSLIEFAEVRSGSGDKMSLKAMTVGKYQKFTNTQAVFAGWAQTIAKMLQTLTANSRTA